VARIGVDATAVSAEGKGIARVQRHTVEALARLGGHEYVVFYRGAEAARLLASADVELVPASGPKTIVWEQLGLPRAVRRHQLDAVVTWTERLPLVGSGNFVVWLFESPSHRIAENRRQGVSAYQRTSDLLTRAVWKSSLRRAGAVLTGSQATGDDLRTELPGVATQALYPALGPGFGPGVGPAEPRYLFHLASSDPRDNTATVLEAFARVRADVRLVVGGGLGERQKPLEAAIRALGLQQRVELTGRLSDEALVGLYQAATVYVDATLYEGFGYQVLEAMACGAPLVCSRASSIPEVVGDAGLLCDPRDAGALALAVERVLGDEALARSLRARGLARAAEFDWQRTARALDAILVRVVSAA
jgi:glycosyltransferase involved in cell wall biosynthesis